MRTDKGGRTGERGACSHILKPWCASATFLWWWTGRWNTGTVQERSLSSYFKPSWNSDLPDVLRASGVFFMRLRLNFHTKEVQISLRLCLNLWTFWSLPSLSFSPCTAGFSHADWALAELPSPDNREGNDRKANSKTEAKVVFWQITGWCMEKYGHQFQGNPNAGYLVSMTLSTHH